MRSFIVLALAGASIAAPFSFGEYFQNKHYRPHPRPSKPYPTGTGIPGISTPSIPGGTGLPSFPVPSGTGIPTPSFPLPTGTDAPSPTDIYSILPYYPTPAVDRRGLQIDYKLAPRNADAGHVARKHPHPHRPHGTGYPHGTGKPSHFPFPTGTSGFGGPTAIPRLPID